MSMRDQAKLNEPVNWHFFLIVHLGGRWRSLFIFARLPGQNYRDSRPCVWIIEPSIHLQDFYGSLKWLLENVVGKLLSYRLKFHWLKVKKFQNSVSIFNSITIQRHCYCDFGHPVCVSILGSFFDVFTG